jgi:hypothetical protein
MKTFKDFIAEVDTKPSFNDVYNDKVARVRKQQQATMQRYKSNPTHMAIQKIKDDEEHDNYVKDLTHKIRKDVKKEYGIEDDD